jgi:hypothetical protein
VRANHILPEWREWLNRADCRLRRSMSCFALSPDGREIVSCHRGRQWKAAIQLHPVRISKRPDSRCHERFVNGIRLSPRRKEKPRPANGELRSLAQRLAQSIWPRQNVPSVLESIWWRFTARDGQLWRRIRYPPISSPTFSLVATISTNIPAASNRFGIFWCADNQSTNTAVGATFYSAMLTLR